MKLRSNIFEIKLDFDNFQVQRLPYVDGQLENLRVDHNQKYSFFRSGDYIYISPSEVDLPPLGELVTLIVSEVPYVVNSLIRHIFFRAFRARFGHIKPTFSPFTFPSTKDNHNLIFDLLPLELRYAVSYKKLNEVFFKMAERDGYKKFLVVINSSYKWAIRQNCQVLHSMGFNITDLDVAVLERHELSNDVVAPSFRSIGRVKSTSETSAMVETNSGEREFLLKELFLNKNHENVSSYLDFILGDSNAQTILRSVKHREAERNDPGVIYSELTQLADVFSKLDFRNGDGFTFSVSNQSSVDFPSLDLEPPQYLFDVSFSKTDSSPAKGLNSFGPYDYGKFFEISNPNVLVVCHRNSAGAFTQFLARLRDGFNESQTFSKGMLAKYRLHSMTFDCVEVENFTKESFVNAIKSAVERGEKTYDLAIIETREEFKKFSPIDDIYWVSKSILLKHGITVQFIKEANARSPKFILDSCALQIYAKLGGTPWVLPSSPNIAHELIIGVGSTLIRANAYSGSSATRFVGITTFFNADGKYLFSNKSREVVYDDYFQELLSSLSGSLDVISREQGWVEGDIVRIIFHVFKPMKNVEVDVVSALVNNYPQFDIKFTFVSFGEHHPYLLFDLDQSGFTSKFASTSKGKLLPRRGTNLMLEKGICVLQLKGPADIKTDKQGFTGPLLVRIHPKSTFVDATYIVQQIYRLTNISYRSFSPSQLPVSLLYAQLITEQLNKFKGVPEWDPIFIKPLRNKKWFI
ncbi:Piwi domain-containing protein [Dyadobacter fermentans]|uniref:Piwi domain-containing protein n=1 Tax=Dyadobacter fermentans TaxID=94254 RepID=UPI001CBB14E8|nr:Piwi domain-containing protein [Dyadobacter fermentans]MBZ1360984.1 hypothetical protein [Dyadobacter fermentans]